MKIEFEDVVSKVAELSERSVEYLLEGYEDGLVKVFGTWKEAFKWLNTDMNDNYDNIEYLLERLVVTTSDDLEGYENLLPGSSAFTFCPFYGVYYRVLCARRSWR